MNNFLVEKCASCLKQNVPLFDAMDENERYYKLVKYGVIIQEIFRKEFFQEVHNCKLCKVCSILLKGAVVLEKGLFSSQLMYDNHLKTFNANSPRSSSEIPNLSVQTQESRRKYVMIPETTSNVIDSEDGYAETEEQLDVLETDIIDTKDIKIEIDETNYETTLNDFNSEATMHIKIETENKIIAKSPAGNVEENNGNQQHSNGAKNAGSTGCSGTNAGTATDAVDADHHEAKAAESNCQKIFFNCNICNRKFSKKLLLVTHLRAHMEVKPFECNLCGRKFSDISNFVRHKRFHAIRNFRAKTFSDKSHVDTDQSQIRTDEKPYKCDLCEKAFKFKSSYRKHSQIHTYKSMCEKPYKCDLCPKMYALEKSFVIHRRIHTGERPFKCDFCEKAFAHKSLHTVHRRIHTGERPYKCDSCGKSYADARSCAMHRRTHTALIPHKCSVCGKAFANRSNYHTHRRIHTGEKPYKCDTCGRAFAQKTYCKAHKRTHTGEKPFKCDLCAKEFTQRSSLNTHHTRAHSTGKPAVSVIKNEPA